MRWRKARSFLSAYCNDELDNRRKLKVSRMLESSPELRRDEAEFRAISDATKEVSRPSVSEDFNNKLLNRVAQERFKETRTKAYLPKPAPLVRWGRAIPAFVTTAAVVLLAFVSFYGTSPDANHAVMAGMDGSNDRHLTAQPTNNPNMAVALGKNWSFAQQMASAERLQRLAEAMRSPSGFHVESGMSHLAGSQSRASQRIPYVPNYYKIRPVLKVYISPRSTAPKEDQSGY